MYIFALPLTSNYTGALKEEQQYSIASRNSNFFWTRWNTELTNPSRANVSRGLQLLQTTPDLWSSEYRRPSPCYQHKGNRPHVDNLAPLESLQCDCALIDSKGAVSEAAAATPTTNNMQHIPVLSPRSPTLLCAQQPHTQSSFTSRMSPFPLDSLSVRKEKRPRDQVKERYELPLATRERELDVEWASVWAGLAGEQSRRTGPLRNGGKKAESEVQVWRRTRWQPGVMRKKEHSGKKDGRR